MHIIVKCTPRKSEKEQYSGQARPYESSPWIYIFAYYCSSPELSRGWVSKRNRSISLFSMSRAEISYQRDRWSFPGTVENWIRTRNDRSRSQSFSFAIESISVNIQKEREDQSATTILLISSQAGPVDLHRDSFGDRLCDLPSGRQTIPVILLLSDSFSLQHHRC